MAVAFGAVWNYDSCMAKPKVELKTIKYFDQNPRHKKQLAKLLADGWSVQTESKVWWTATKRLTLTRTSA